ncbi:hypothetical protein FNH22_24635 [Fulvivirga sp. M361]|uniref:DUF6438 domain-containing protein n=1 Tax=Fulvivirga sp. M361 TaxID=2594266 RepID=UPI00117A5DB6|nr:DUF6438 domain-containing protein [Fulvivirga sp. M361]TRX51184.1 hypothetical protein FNH22_24635 [Fulvivirga sp. M361]
MAQKTDSTVLFSQQKTACYGYCPTYELKVFKDGRVELHGEANVDLIGLYTSRLNELELTYFRQEFEKIGFFELKDRYDKDVSDLSTTYIYFNNGSQSKKIMDYYGAPATLKRLEKELEGLLKKLEWKAVKDQ